MHDDNISVLTYIYYARSFTEQTLNKICVPILRGCNNVFIPSRNTVYNNYMNFITNRIKKYMKVVPDLINTLNN